jgi:hypothetical protein
MIDSVSVPRSAAANLVACPLCHTECPSLTQEALSSGGSWRCVRCRQHWDAGRLSAVAAYAAFVAARQSSTARNG